MPWRVHNFHYVLQYLAEVCMWGAVLDSLGLLSLLLVKYSFFIGYVQWSNSNDLLVRTMSFLLLSSTNSTYCTVRTSNVLRIQLCHRMTIT
jgi:hypothetical protein